MNLRDLSPAQLKKYGIYAVLWFFMMLSLYLIMSDRSDRKSDIAYERNAKEELQLMLIDQVKLKKEQDSLIYISQEAISSTDTLRDLSIDIAKKSNTAKKQVKSMKNAN